MGRAANATKEQRAKMPRSIFCDPENLEYPIEDQGDVDSAASLIGKAENPAAVKACVIRKAKAHGWHYPDAWKDTKEKAAPVTEAPFALDLDFKATADDNGTLVLRGYASTFEQDRDRETVTPDALRAAVSKYMRNPVIVDEHVRDRPIGYVREATVDDRGLLVEAVIPPPPPGTEAWHIKAYHDIKHGIRRAFSIGGLFKRDGRKIVGIDLVHIGTVTAPSNPASLFAVVQKSFQLPQAGRTAADTLSAVNLTAATDLLDALGKLPR